MSFEPEQMIVTNEVVTKSWVQNHNNKHLLMTPKHPESQEVAIGRAVRLKCKAIMFTD